jgi:hypothetical protein
MEDKPIEATKGRPARRKPLQWQPIDSAPKDGTQILCFTKWGDYEISHWRPITHCWVSKRGFLVEATHWSSLPAPPGSPD